MAEKIQEQVRRGALAHLSPEERRVHAAEKVLRDCQYALSRALGAHAAQQENVEQAKAQFKLAEKELEEARAALPEDEED